MSSHEKVEVGDVVEVAGVVGEPRPGCDGCSPDDVGYANLTVTRNWCELGDRARTSSGAA